MNPLYINRIQNELQHFDSTINYDEYPIIKVSFYYRNCLYSFHLKGYPFKSPIKFFKNNILIDYTPNTLPGNLYTLYFSYYKKCPCCESILCPNNWTPGYKLTKIIEEYYKFKNKITDLQKIKFFKKSTDFPIEVNDIIISFLLNI